MPSFNSAIAADIVGLLCKAPRTLAELADLCECSREAVETWVKRLQSEGVVYQAGVRPGARGTAPAVYAWQPSIVPLIGRLTDDTTTIHGDGFTIPRPMSA